MGVDLHNCIRDIYPSAWGLLLNPAVAFGWEPKGIEMTVWSDGDPIEYWDEDYCASDGRLVTDEDIAGIVRGLGRALAVLDADPKDRLTLISADLEVADPNRQEILEYRQHVIQNFDGPQRLDIERFLELVAVTGVAQVAEIHRKMGFPRFSLNRD